MQLWRHICVYPCEMIEDPEHGVEHDDDLHPVALAADVEESRNVVENDRHLFENLERR